MAPLAMSSTTFLKTRVVFLLMMWAVPAVQAQQTKFTLQQAVAIGLEKNPARKLAAADIAMAEATRKQSLTPLLPQIGFAETFTRGNDPVYVFGTKLRQQNFQASDFALNSLNRPTPINNFNMSFVGRWTAFDSLHTLFERKRASLLKDSAGLSEGRTDQEIIYRVVSAYETVLIAAREAEVAQHAVETAQALQTLSRNRVDTGLAVEADVLSAQVNLATRQQELIQARGAESTAWVELEVAMGVDLPRGPETLDSLSEHTFSASQLTDEVAQALKKRPDLKSLAIQNSAQQMAVKSAKSVWPAGRSLWLLANRRRNHRSNFWQQLDCGSRDSD